MCLAVIAGTPQPWKQQASATHPTACPSMPQSCRTSAWTLATTCAWRDPAPSSPRPPSMSTSQTGSALLASGTSLAFWALASPVPACMARESTCTAQEGGFLSAAARSSSIKVHQIGCPQSMQGLPKQNAPSTCTGRYELTVCRRY